MYIAVAQVNPEVGALKTNAEKALAMIEALAAGAYPPDLVVFPAFALSGAPLEGLAYSDAFAAECLDVAKDFISRSTLPTLIGTVIPRPIEGEFAFVCEPEVLYCRDGKGGALGFVDADNAWDEFTEATSVKVNLDGHIVTVVLDSYPDPDDDLSGSDLVIMMLAKEYRHTNTMFTSSNQLQFLRSLARGAQAGIICANLVGGQDSAVFDGASVVIGSEGEIISAAPPFEENVFTCNLTPGKPDKAVKTPGVSTSVSDDVKVVKPLLPYEADWKALKVAIHDYVAKNGFSDVVVGISGGIDSAVTATLAVDALGADHVHGVLMPGPFSSEGSVTDATALAESLGIETLTIPITEPFALFRRISQDVIGQEGSHLAIQNLQARIRTIYLMHLANTFGWLLLNTGNKSEAAMGFSTLYGDTSGAIAPLGNLYKGDVYGLAAWRNQQKQVIPADILQKAPSAELYDGQRDQDTLPPYDILDRILRLHIEDGLGVDQILEYSQREPEGAALDAALVVRVRSAPLPDLQGRDAPRHRRAWIMLTLEHAEQACIHRLAPAGGAEGR
jgi:NAD+ synthase (glutamine-hydrolysing)